MYTLIHDTEELTDAPIETVPDAVALFDGWVIETALDGVGVGVGVGVAVELRTLTVTEAVPISASLDEYAFAEIVWLPSPTVVEFHENVFGGLDAR